MSTRKGTEKEAEVHRILEEAGYTVARPCRSIKYIPDGHGSRRPVVSHQDLFGAFDRIAIRKDRPTTFVQVCSNHSDAIAERKKKIQELDLPVTDIAIIFAWQGGGKRVDLRYKSKGRYKPYQYYNMYVYRHYGEIGWCWEGPVMVFKKPQLFHRCWVCNQRLDRQDQCFLHTWADNGKVTL